MNIPRITKLNNGLRVVTEHVSDVDSVALNVRVEVGSSDEGIEQNGISHFLEHMAFKGTKTRNAFEIARAFDDIGGVFNASTTRESTNYYAKVLKKEIQTGIDILVDILTNSKFPEDELEREKCVIMQEIFQTNDSPSDVIFDKFFETAYKNQSFGRSILGTHNTVKSFTREDLNSYMNEHYFGENTTFSIVGDVSHEEIVSLTRDSLSEISKNRPKKRQSVNYTGGKYLENRKLDQVHLLIGLPTVSLYDDRYYTFQVLDFILGNGMSSRLFQRVREKQGLAYSVYSFNSSYRDAGILSVFAGTDSSNLNKLLKSITTELKKLSTNDLKEEEVNRVKKRIKSQTLMSRESISSRAEALGYYYGNYNRYIGKSELIEKISEVTVENVREAAGKLLSYYDKTTLAAIGEINSLPKYEEVVSMFSI